MIERLFEKVRKCELEHKRTQLKTSIRPTCARDLLNRLKIRDRTGNDGKMLIKRFGINPSTPLEIVEASDPQRVLQDVYAVIADRKEHPREGSYTNYLFDKGIDKILKKVGEEAAEIIIAAKNPDRTESIYEIADLLYHLMVLMCEKGLTWEDIAGELADRE